MKNICRFLWIFCLFAMSAFAGDDGSKSITEAVVRGPFDRGVWELEGGAGEFC